MLSYYQSQSAILVAICILWLLAQHLLSRKASSQSLGGDARPSLAGDTSQALAKLTRQYLLVYAIVMGADWLQGPYVYSLYREQYGFPERLVALLFVTGFLSAGVTAPLIGAWADQFGRKRLCLVFCVTYSLACLCILIPYLPILLVGRLLGGISTSILYSAFESWLISSSNSLGLSQSDLSTVLGRATLANGFVAAGAGVASNQLVAYTGSFASTFMASGLLLVVAWFVIRTTWTENYGTLDSTRSGPNVDILQGKRLLQAWKKVITEPSLLVLGFTQTCFEGSMYLFVFLWVPSLQETVPSTTTLPLGYIFSCFMISMMLGSLLYSSVVSYFSSPVTVASSGGNKVLLLQAKLSSLVCAVGAVTFAVATGSNMEHIRFWAFCVFESCVGMYYPVQGMLRGSLISNEHRATLASLFRVPLNIFVVVSLLTGVSSARYMVLTTSACLLALSSVMTGVVIVDRLDSPPVDTLPSRDA